MATEATSSSCTLFDISFGNLILSDITTSSSFPSPPVASSSFLLPPSLLPSSSSSLPVLCLLLCLFVLFLYLYNVLAFGTSSSIGGGLLLQLPRQGGRREDLYLSVVKVCVMLSFYAYCLATKSGGVTEKTFVFTLVSLAALWK
eukprot:GHVS01063159.1.p1 GENE.GHVS01063159.1~~GHVS01063159.1.p1  ORF type:complete len:144 (+),score=54.27 GHVS01063159.1:304-735(+)